ncbi:hypothetical protein GC173_18930 [bacterium]|nr:hypothetical protein [bacterium]
MSNDSAGPPGNPEEDKQLPTSAKAPTWEIVLEKATDESSVPGTEGKAPTNERWSRMLKMAFPVIILLIYGGYKLWGNGLPSFQRETNPGGPTNPKSLTGVAPATEEFERVSRDKQLREFVGQLEASASRQEWRALTTIVNSQQDDRLRDHPVVKALAALARTRSGERSLALETQLIELDTTLQGAGTQYATLSEEIRVARIDQALARISDWDILQRNTDLFLQLLGAAAETPYEVTVRQKLARRYESMADEKEKGARGYLSSDTIALREARSIYQSGLRMLVEAKGWAALTPISAGTAPDIERIVEKIRRLNYSINGPSIPFTNSDSNTWSGTKGDPVHTPPVKN